MFKGKMKYIIISLSMFLIATTAVYCNEDAQISIQVNGAELDLFDFDQNIETPSIIIDGRTLIPLRKMFAVFGVEPQWNSEDRSITAAYNGQEIWLQINNSEAKINGVSTYLDVPAQIVQNRTYVPLRFITETFGVIPSWDDETRVVSFEVDPLEIENTIDETEDIEELIIEIE